MIGYIRKQTLHGYVEDARAKQALKKAGLDESCLDLQVWHSIDVGKAALPAELLSVPAEDAVLADTAEGAVELLRMRLATPDDLSCWFSRVLPLGRRLLSASLPVLKEVDVRTELERARVAEVLSRHVAVLVCDADGYSREPIKDLAAGISARPCRVLIDDLDDRRHRYRSRAEYTVHLLLADAGYAGRRESALHVAKARSLVVTRDEILWFVGAMQDLAVGRNDTQGHRGSLRYTADRLADWLHKVERLYGRCAYRNTAAYVKFFTRLIQSPQRSLKKIHSLCQSQDLIAWLKSELRSKAVAAIRKGTHKRSAYSLDLLGEGPVERASKKVEEQTSNA